MSKKEVTEKLKNPLTPRAFVVGLIICISGSIIAALGIGFAPSVYLTNSLPDRMISTFIILVILSIFINPLLKTKGFSSGELVVIYVMSMVQLIQNQSWRNIVTNLAAFASPLSATALQFTPDIWIPKDPSIWQPMLTGGVAVPWADWVAPVTYWIILQLSILGIGMSFGLILRHSIIEVERLPFPFTEVVAPLTIEVKKPVRERINAPLLLVGLVIGFIIQGTYGFFQRVIPGFPDFWPRGLYGMMGYDLGPIVGPDIARNQHLLLSLGDLPLFCSFFFLVPTKIMGSMLLVHFLIGNIAPYIEVGAGMITNFSTLGLYDVLGWMLNMFGTLFESTGIQWFTLTAIGFPVGFIIAYIFFVRREIAASLKATLHGSRKESLLWITFAVSIVLYVALTSGFGIPLTTSFLFVFYTFLFLIINVRIRGEGYWGMVPVGPEVADSAFLASGGMHGSQEAYLSRIMFGEIQSQSLLRAYTPVFMPLEGIRLLEMSGEKWRWSGVVVATVVATVLGVILNQIFYLWGTYTYGQLIRWNIFDFAAVSGGISDTISSVMTPGSYAMGVVPARLWPETIIGIVVAVVITVLNHIFIWWPIHPLGLLMGPYLGWGYSFQALLAFIARVAILKIGGAKLYNKALQVVLGLFLGWALSQVFYIVSLSLA